MWYKRIRTKIFLAMLLATIVPLGMTSVIIFYQVSRSLDEQKTFARDRVEQDLKGRIDDFFQNLNETAYQIYSNPDLIEAIALNKAFLTDSRTYETVKDIEQFFLGVFYQSRVKDIIGMYIIRNDGELMGHFFPADNPQFKRSYYESLVADMRSNEYKPLTLIHYTSAYREPVIQFLYPVRYRGRPNGLLVIDLKENSFRSQVERYNVFYRGEVTLLSKSGQVLYDTDSSKAGRPQSHAAKSGRTVLIETSIDDSNWLIQYSYQIDPRQILYQRLALAMIGVAGLLALILTLALSYNLTKPIVMLHRKMGRIQIGDYTARVDVRTQDEIGFLGKQFNRMAETIQQLIDHDLALQLMNKESQIKALQAQISPHFLFNTLQMMAGIADIDHSPDMKLICQSLGNMYRYNMDIDNEWVRLRDEIMHIRNYLVITNKRYAGVIRFRLQIEQGDSDYPIPKLILQPIVENAVEHGLIPGTRSRKLLRMSVRADREYRKLIIHVIDNGEGMDDPSSLDLESRLNPQIVNERRLVDETPIGLSNVHARIRLICGEPYGIVVTSRKGTGTCVTFMLPLKEDNL